MEIGRVTSNAAMGPGRIGKTVEPMPQELMPEIPAREESYCSLHISDEGYRRWELSQQLQQEDSAAEASNGQLQTEAVEPAAEVLKAADVPDRVARVMRFIDARADVVSNTRPEATKETDDEKTAALEQLRQLKEEQQAEYEQMEQEARELAQEQNKLKSTEEKGMRDLTIMLESFKPLDDGTEEKEKASGQNREDKAQSREDENAAGTDIRDEMLGIGSRIRSEAFQAELAMDDTIDRIYQKAKENLDEARVQDQAIRDGLEDVYEVLSDDSSTDEEKDAAVDTFIENGRHSLSEMKVNLSTGLARMQNIREIKRERLDNQNMVYAKRAQDSIEAQAGQAAVDQLYQDGYEDMKEETIEELTEHIEELLKKQQRPDAADKDEEAVAADKESESKLQTEDEGQE